MDTTTSVTLESLKDQILSPNQLHVVRDLLRSNPKAWREFGDLYTRTRCESLDFVLKDTVEYESILCGVQQLRHGLLGENYTSLEEVVVEQIVNNHLRAAKADIKLSEIKHSKETEHEELYWDSVHERSHNRILRGIKTLAIVRKAENDIKIKLYKNRPAHYDRNDYLDKSTEELGSRQLPVEFYEQRHHQLTREKFNVDWQADHVEETNNEELNQAINFARNRSQANQHPLQPWPQLACDSKESETETESQSLEEMKAHEGEEIEIQNPALQSHQRPTRFPWHQVTGQAGEHSSPLLE